MEKRTERSVLVTGGNRGIGLAIVEEMANNHQDKILLGCRDFEAGQKEAKKINVNGNVQAVVMDLSSPDVLSGCIKALIRDHGQIDVLINNSGVLYEGSVIEVSMDKIDETIRVNTLSAIQLIKEFLPSMIKNNYGRIVNVSSGWGSISWGLEGPFAYSVSKAAINAVTLAASKKLPGNVKINSASPGWVRTRMGGMNAALSTQQGADTIVWLANLPENGPSGGFFSERKRIDW